MAYDETDKIPLSEPTTENATKFHLQDVPIAQRRSEYDVGEDVPDMWLRFYGYNTGVWNGFWADNERRRKQDNQAMLDAMAGYLGLSRHQRERARYLLHDFPFAKYGSYYTVRDISLIVCLLVTNVDYRGDGMVYYPTKKYSEREPVDEETARKPPSEKRVVFEEFHETFQRLIDSLGVKPHVLEKGIPKFRDVLNANRPEFNPPI